MRVDFFFFLYVSGGMCRMMRWILRGVVLVGGGDNRNGVGWDCRIIEECEGTACEHEVGEAVHFRVRLQMEITQHLI